MFILLKCLYFLNENVQLQLYERCELHAFKCKINNQI